MGEKIRPPKWNSFSKYPPQGADVYIRCQSKTKPEVRNMALLYEFNASTFNPQVLLDKLPKDDYCNFEWVLKSEMDKFRKTVSEKL